MKVRKSDLFLILFSLALLSIIFFLPNIIDIIEKFFPSRSEKDKLYVIISFLLFLWLIYDIYSDIRAHKYVTTIFIIIADVIMLICIIFVIITEYQSFMLHAKHTLIPAKKALDNYIHQKQCTILFSISLLLKDFLKTERFLIKEKKNAA